MKTMEYEDEGEKGTHFVVGPCGVTCQAIDLSTHFGQRKERQIHSLDSLQEILSEHKTLDFWAIHVKFIPIFMCLLETNCENLRENERA